MALCKRFRVVKPEIRILGVDDGTFVPHSKGHALVVGVVFRGGYWLDGVLHTKIRVDGLDATRKIAAMILGSPHCKQLRIIMLDGVTFAGFNVVDIRQLSTKTKIPVIAITRDKPDFLKIHEALNNLSDREKRWKAIRGTGELYVVRTRGRAGQIYMQVHGVCEEDARRIVQLTSTRSNVPEPLRVAHLVASGISWQAA